MPSSVSITRPRLPLTKLGAAAASAAVAGVLAGSALTSAPADAATVASAAHAGTQAATASATPTTPAGELGGTASPGLAGPETTLTAAPSPGLGHTVSLAQDETQLAVHAAPAHSASTAGDHDRTKAAVRRAPQHHQAARHETRARHAAPARPAQPFQFYDSVTPSAIPAGHEIATYADGPFAVSPSQVAGHQVLWIDTNGSDPRANALDVEPGDATPSSAATWVSSKLTASPHSIAIVYTMISDWQATKDAVATLPNWMQSHVRWWIADPTGVPHVVPGANATQWYWGTNYDISNANPGF
jgi:hypothetical protein